MRKLLTFIILLVCTKILFAYDFSAECSTGQTLYYNIISNTEPYTVELTYKRIVDDNGTGYSIGYIHYNSVFIPSTVLYNNKTYTVTSIGSSAFRNCSELTSVAIPNSVTNIGACAFYECSGLTSLTIGTSVESIGNSAFSGCGLTGTLTIPNSVLSIESAAFCRCNGLTSVVISNSVTNIISDAFEKCNGLETIWVSSDNIVYDSRNNCNAIIETETNTLIIGCKNTIIPNSVIKIGKYAFNNCIGLTSITIPNSVTSIGYFAFRNCPLTDIYSNPVIPPDRIESSSGNLSMFSSYNATLWVPCGSAEAYASTGEWANFYDIREIGAYLLNVTTENPQMGTVNVIQQPNCSDGTAIIQANANEGYQFVQWNDGSTENPHTITVTEDTTFIATFASVNSLPETEIPVISIYPNPANDILNITSPENISSVEIVNVVGQVVISEETNGNSASCNIEKLESGLYFVKIHSDSQTEHIHKFIKE